MSEVRTRIAPSPTGPLHVGTARAALFNELFARNAGGKFIVRIEDTDKERSKPEFEQNILSSFKWLGLVWDEGPDVGGEYGPYRQSERVESQYKNAIQRLLDEGKAYMEDQAVRLKVEPQEVTFQDEVRGKVTVHTDSFGGDFIVARSLTDPVFHLAVVVDDEAMKISHVIRGEDHLHNTIKHILIQRALGYEQPVYAHLPLILDEQRKKLSKRTNETDLLAYKEMGILPEAMLNYLALLGWGARDEQEFFTHEDLVKEFSLDRVQKGGAIFSLQKLQSINKAHIKKLSDEELTSRAEPFLTAADIEVTEQVRAALVTEQERIATLAELPEAISFVLPEWSANYNPELLIWRKSTQEQTSKLIELLISKVKEIPAENFSEKQLEEVLMNWIDAEDLGRGDTLWPMRVALTGREHSPGPFEVAAILGKEQVLVRLQQAQELL